MYKYKITVEYFGSPFVGWQKQNNGPSVQQYLEDAIFQISQTQTKVYCAGRTDAGVHALGQVCHFEIPNNLPSDKMRRAINYYLANKYIVVKEASNLGCNSNFHARFDATSREYIYKIYNRDHHLTIEKQLYWWVPIPLDESLMHEGAQHLVGTHDFTSFRAKECQSPSPIKTINEISLTRNGDIVQMHIMAKSFLHHQVRNIIGSLYMVGTKRWHPHNIRYILEKKDRAKAGVTAPPSGLYFYKVNY